jgi:hypothetical protein
MIQGIVLKLVIQWAFNWLAGWLESQATHERIVVADPKAMPKMAAPHSVVVRHKVVPVDTRPGHFNRQTGTWNP